MKEEIVKFVSEWERMCSAISCTGCPINDCYDTAAGCKEYFRKYPDRVAAVVTAWSEAHPIETYAMKLKKVLPDGNYEEIMSNVCPGDIFGQSGVSFSANCPETCAICWHSEVKE